MFENVEKDSERSEECNDFTMIITSRNNTQISNYGGGFRCKSEYPWCIIEFSKKSRKTKKKNDGKTGIFTQNQFSTKSIFFMFVIQKLITLNYQKNFTFFDVDKKILDDQIRKDNDLLSNDFKYFISRRYLKILPVIEIGVFLTQLKFSIYFLISKNFKPKIVVLELHVNKTRSIESFHNFKQKHTKLLKKLVLLSEEIVNLVNVYQYGGSNL
ncbi:Uncharacterized protein FWK35_00017166 [Aphis craccivora]|uniref:Uncharacterized protein n=1 Tax=Aphis craccivora TaxID=307492 RepID=A0A6G0Y7E0_APHCR|nr:Uncharacterized protein FWK35_00017166 [Aphis craccivora]